MWKQVKLNCMIFSLSGYQSAKDNSFSSLHAYPYLQCCGWTSIFTIEIHTWNKEKWEACSYYQPMKTSCQTGRILGNLPNVTEENVIGYVLGSFSLHSILCVAWLHPYHGLFSTVDTHEHSKNGCSPGHPYSGLYSYVASAMLE
jgi:hypothetical protein